MYVLDKVDFGVFFLQNKLSFSSKYMMYIFMWLFKNECLANYWNWLVCLVCILYISTAFYKDLISTNAL
jgi:hypothetical protein